MEYYLETYEAALSRLDTGVSGLTRVEAEKRLLENGRNELARKKGKSLARRLAEQLINPMVLILLAAAGISIAISFMEGGSIHELTEAGVILAVVVINSILGVFQESKAEKAIEALQEMSAAVVKVRRGGVAAVIPAGELVTGDVVLLEAGGAVPADVRLIRCASLRVEEAALTGESVPVEKHADPLSEDGGGKITLGDRKNMAYMGTEIVYGRGEGVVVATGMETEMGKIALIIQNAGEGETPLQKRLSQLSRILSALVLAICLVIFVINLVAAGEINADFVMGSFMLAVSLAVAAIPEGLAAVVTIALSIGVTNMAKRNAIIRKLTAVETLGCAQVICTDKTGTITQNRMTVVESFGDAAPLARAMALCCDSQLTPEGAVVGDPTENALVSFALKEGFDKNELTAENPRVAEAPFDSVRKMMSTIHEARDGYIQYTKGAPDEILGICSGILSDGRVTPLDEAARLAVIAKNGEYADKALRVLACAYKNHVKTPEDCGPEKIENEMTFIGLMAMIDPVRPESVSAVESCRNAGIKVVMITGDHKDTAAAIAREIGVISDAAQVMTGRELEGLSDAEFENRIENTYVYARVQPEHKVRIVDMWKRKGFVTAMTGDGVNDAPAVKSGDIGVGMGISGTDVTKNVADMVLADDNFATIVAAVEEGRRIYDNIVKTIQFLLGSNMSEVIVVFVATLMGFVLFKPVHLLFINLITDSIPAVALGMERAQAGVMERPPRSEKDSVFAGGVGFNITYQGVIIAVLTLAAYFIVDIWDSHEVAMTSAFLTISMCELFHSVSMRSLKQSVFSLKKQNALLWGAIGVSFALTITIIYTPALASLFSLAPLTIEELVTSLCLSIAVIPAVEIVKAFQRRRESARKLRTA